MPEPLSQPVLDRLSKLLGMLGSSHDGERANAATLATKLLKEHDWTWADFVHALEGAAPTRRPHPADEEPQFDDDTRNIETINMAATECLCRPDLLNEWEAAFCRSMTHWDSPVSNKQLSRLVKLRQRVQGAQRGSAAA
jgi:hypothetical protein